MADLERFLEANGPSLFRLLFRISTREDVAEDLMQDLFVKLRTSAGFRSADQPLAYARRVATNLALDWRRKSLRRQQDSSNVEGLNDHRPNSVVQVANTDLKQLVLDTLGELPEKQKELLVRRYLQQVPYKTLADEAGKTKHQMRALCSKALAKLRDLIAAKTTE